MINRMTGGYFDREHGGGPEAHAGWFGGGDRGDRDYRDRTPDREREIERDRERDRYGARQQPSIINRMTGGYLDREHGGGAEAREARDQQHREYEREHRGGGGIGARHLSEHEQELQRQRGGQYEPRSLIDRVTGRDPNDPRGLVDRMTGRDPNDPRGVVDRVMGREQYPSEHRTAGGVATGSGVGGASSGLYDAGGDHHRTGTTTYSHGGPTTSGGLQTGHTGSGLTSGEHHTTTSQRNPPVAQWSQDTSRPVDQRITTTTGSGAV
jgi:hypothetical protein